jgi:hypothetical protein
MELREREKGKESDRASVILHNTICECILKAIEK